MIYSNFTGRVAKKARVIDGVNGQFLSMDLAVNDFSKGEEATQWVRVQSSDPAHLKLVEYFTKGRILTIHGNIKIDQWEGKDGTPHAQLRVHAKNIDFLNIGKKQEGANAAANAATDTNVPDAPTDTPKEKGGATRLPSVSGRVPGRPALLIPFGGITLKRDKDYRK